MSSVSNIRDSVTFSVPPASVPVHGREVRAFWIMWTLVTTLVLFVVISGIPVRYDKVRAADPDIRAGEFRNLIAVGVSPEVAAAADIAQNLLVFLTLLGGGTLLLARAPNSRAAVFLSATFILYGSQFGGLASAHRSAGPPAAQSVAGVLATIVCFLQSTATWTTMFWLPEGRFISSWRAWLTSGLIATLASVYSLVSFPRSHDLVNMLALPVVVLGICGQILHYRGVANPVTRQQIKWAVSGIVVGAMSFLLSQTVFLWLGNLEGFWPATALVVTRLLMGTSQIAVLVCFGVAILRYRLWQIDLVINRSLVYGAVTVLLVLVFLGGGFTLQTMVGKDQTPIAFALSIAGAGLLFNPSRRQAQRFVDRRLYGFRFDLDELNRAQQVHTVKNPGALTGRTLGRYRILGLLGKGGMGEVYQGECEGRLVAIKTLPQDAARGTEFHKWFERESRTLATVDHPNIVKFHESGTSEAVDYMVLDFIEGLELSTVIRKRGRLPLDEVRPFLQDCATALDYAHERGLVHRDIKPSNIMIRRKADGKTMEAVLMDFGIARTSDAQTALTTTGAVGTISYMAPEQIMAATTVDRRADVYALGVTVYEMLTGELPFKGNPAQVLFAHLQQRPADPGELMPDLPANVVRAIMKALEKHPEDRFQSVGEFVVAVTRF